MADQTDTTTGDQTAPAATEKPLPKLPTEMPFRHFLATYRKGETDQEIGDALAELVRAVKLHGKSGSLTLTIKVADTGDNHVTLTHDVKTTLPRPDKTPSILFVDDECRLWRDDPNRPGFYDEQLAVRAEVRATPPAGVDPETGEIVPVDDRKVVEARERFASGR